VGFRQRNALGDGEAYRFRRADDSHRTRVALDDDLASGLHPPRDCPDVLRQVAFADVPRLHTWNRAVSVPRYPHRAAIR
jgi:hypothetical protein